MNVSELISGHAEGVAPQTDIVPGEKVRSYDFAGVRNCYVEGVVVKISNPIEGCKRYEIMVEKRVLDGTSISVADPYVYPPVNGTPMLFGGITNLVERIVEQ